MATFSKFNQFVLDLVNGVHNFNSGHVFKVVLSNTAPSSGNTILSNITQIANGNGYTTGGATVTVTTSASGGVAKVTISADPSWTASGSVGPFRYAVLYNDTPTSPADPLIGYWDNGSSITLASGDTFTVDYDQTNGVFTIA